MVLKQLKNQDSRLHRNKKRFCLFYCQLFANELIPSHPAVVFAVRSVIRRGCLLYICTFSINHFLYVAMLSFALAPSALEQSLFSPGWSVRVFHSCSLFLPGRLLFILVPNRKLVQFVLKRCAVGKRYEPE